MRNFPQMLICIVCSLARLYHDCNLFVEESWSMQSDFCGVGDSTFCVCSTFQIGTCSIVSMAIVGSSVVSPVIARLITSVEASMIAWIHVVVTRCRCYDIYRSTEVLRRGIVLPAPWYWYYFAIGCVTAEARSIVIVLLLRTRPRSLCAI